MPNKLKPCPFCNSNDAFLSRADNFTFVIQCLDCGATGPYTTNKEDAITEWNRRAGEE